MNELNRLATELLFHEVSQVLLFRIAELLRDILSFLPDGSTSKFRAECLDIDTTDVAVRALVIHDGTTDTALTARTRARSETILAMLNATPQALTHIDEAVMTHVNQYVIPRLTEAGVVDFAEMAAAIADLARAVTRSDRAEVYVAASGSGSSAHRVAHSTRDSSRDVGPWVQSGSSALVDRVLHTNRAKHTGADDSTELATPVPGGLASPHESPIGVLLLQRSNTDRYSAYHMALARNVCLRLAVLHTTEATGKVARAIADLRSVPLSTMAGSLAPILDLPEPQDLPPDVQLALSRVPSVLETVTRASNSSSVTVRIAVPDAEADEPHGLVLRRVAAFPADVMHDPDLILKQAHGGTSWRAVLTGQLHYAPDAASDEYYRPTRADTQSALTVPIKVEGRLLGTINMESRMLANYGPFLPQAEALAGALGRSFADAEAYFTQPVLARAAEVLDHGHDYEANLRQLKMSPALATLGGSERQTVEDFIDDGLDLITRTTRGWTDSSDEVAQTVWTALNNAYERRPVLSLSLPDWSNVETLNRPLEAGDARLIESAITNVFANMKRYAGDPGIGPTGYTPPTMETSECTWAGGQFLTITFWNTSSDYISSQISTRVYRIPIESSDGTLRLGSYLAALRIRQVRGTIAFAVADEGVRARTVLMIPLTQDRGGR